MTTKGDAFARRLLAWFDRSGRHDLPWQKRPTRYRVWVSEVMLQQTRVATVIPYFERFIARFPEVGELATADVDEVLHLWSGLGYYARGRNLHKAARSIVSQHGGRCPDDIESWLALPGVGRSTAGAILALCGGQRHAILDGNVKRVLTRYHGIYGWPGQRATQKTLWDRAWAHTPTWRVADYTQAIMDLGATLCTRSQPDCGVCPQQITCHAWHEDAQTRLPEPKPRKIMPVRARRMLVLRDADGAVLLLQRPPTGIWGGLWSLPELAADETPGDWCARHIGGVIGEPREWPVLRHSFSHFHLDITPVCIELDTVVTDRIEETGRLWYKRSAPPAIGLAAPVEKLLHAAGAE